MRNITCWDESHYWLRKTQQSDGEDYVIMRTMLVGISFMHVAVAYDLTQWILSNLLWTWSMDCGLNTSPIYLSFPSRKLGVCYTLASSKHVDDSGEWEGVSPPRCFPSLLTITDCHAETDFEVFSFPNHSILSNYWHLKYLVSAIIGRVLLQFSLVAGCYEHCRRPRMIAVIMHLVSIPYRRRTRTRLSFLGLIIIYLSLTQIEPIWLVLCRYWK